MDFEVNQYSNQIHIPTIFVKDIVTMNVHDQLNPVATEAADPRILAGRISPIINHGIGPKPKLKLSTYMTKVANGNHPSCETLLTSTSFI